MEIKEQKEKAKKQNNQEKKENKKVTKIVEDKVKNISKEEVAVEKINTETKEEIKNSKEVVKENKSEIKKEKNNKKLNKRTIIALSICVAIIVGIIIAIFVNQNSNPVDKIEKQLLKYYENYVSTEDETSYDQGTINKIDEQISKWSHEYEFVTMLKERTSLLLETWYTDFNIEYKNVEELEKLYERMDGTLSSLDNNLNGFNTMFDYSEYRNFSNYLDDMYDSKKAYFSAKEYEVKEDTYNAYLNYKKVMIDDVYYSQVQEWIKKYEKTQTEEFQKKVNSMVDIKEGMTKREILDSYIKQLDYIKDNSTINSIDISETNEYKKSLDESKKNVVIYSKEVALELSKEYNYDGAIEVIDNAKSNFRSDESEYTELKKLMDEYESKKPDKLASVRGGESSYYIGSSTTIKKINDVKYNGEIHFSFSGETEYMEFRLDKKYTKLKATIVRGPNWENYFDCVIVIYGDGKEIYRSSKIERNNEIDANLEVNVKDINDLRIEFVTTDKWPTSYTKFYYLYLAEPMLYKE